MNGTHGNRPEAFNGGRSHRLLIKPACVLAAVATGALALGPNLAFHPLPVAACLVAQSLFAALFCSDANRSVWFSYEDGRGVFFEGLFAQASWRRIAFLCGLCGTWLVLGTLPSALWAWLV